MKSVSWNSSVTFETKQNNQHRKCGWLKFERNLLSNCLKNRGKNNCVCARDLSGDNRKKSAQEFLITATTSHLDPQTLHGKSYVFLRDEKIGKRISFQLETA